MELLDCYIGEHVTVRESSIILTTGTAWLQDRELPNEVRVRESHHAAGGHTTSTGAIALCAASAQQPTTEYGARLSDSLKSGVASLREMGFLLFDWSNAMSIAPV